MGAKHGPPQSSSALALMYLTCGGLWALRKILRIPYTSHVTNVEVRATTGCRPVSYLVSDRRLRLFGTYCPQLTTRGPPPCCRCDDPGAASRLEATVIEDPATPGFVQWRQTLANRTLALHLPGGRQLFVMTGGALWTQQHSSRVRYKRKEEDLSFQR